MTERSETVITADTRSSEIFSGLTPFEKEIYCYLQNGQQTALNIAKAVKKKFARDVNPDLYRMMEKNVLEQNKTFWKIKALAERDSEETTGDKITEDSGVLVSKANYNANGIAEPGCSGGAEQKKIELTELQKQIYAFLKSNAPSKAITIAKAVGKTYAKDVNSDLYQMKRLCLLSYNEKLWSINADLNQKFSESSAPSSEDSVVSQSYIEMDGFNFSDSKDIRRDSGIEVTSLLANETMRDKSSLTGTLPGESHLQHEVRIPSPSNTMRDESYLTGPPTEESHLQYGSQMWHSLQNISKSYNIHLYQCSNITIGDTTLLTKGDAEPISTVSLPATFLYGPGGNSQPLPSDMPTHQTGPPWEASDWIVNQPNGIGEIHSQHEYCDTDTSSQEAEQQNDSALGHSRQSGELSLLNTEGDEGPFSAPCTSSPVPSSYFKQTLNISGICEDLGNVTLEEQDKNCEDHVVISSFAESLS